MREIVKKTGKFFLALKEKDEKDLRQSVLLLDGSFILPNNFALILKGARKKFKNAKLVVLTFQEKEEFIGDNFPGVEIVVPDNRSRGNKHRLAAKLLFLLLRRRFKFIVLSSLDVSLLGVSLIFGRSPVFLHNRWMEWYVVRRRTLSDLIRGRKSADTNRRRTNRGIKEILKSFGRSFLILTEINEGSIKSCMLIEDNGYTEIGHIINAVRNAERIFINPDITLLTFEARKTDLINNFPNLKVVTSSGGSRYDLAIQMCRLAKHGFKYVILTTLDISPIISAFFFTRARLLLYNRWHQWWSLGIRNLFGYSKIILVFLFMVPVFLYLFISAGLILARMKLRLLLIDAKYTLERE